MSSIVSRALFLILFLSCAVSARAQDEPRHALVIGNADYQLGVLPNPINDARSMAAVLVETGFRTTVLENVTKLDFETGVAAFLSSLPEGSVGLFYFAGQGIQKDGRNYLLPVDAQAGSIEEVIAGSISASDLVTEFHERGIDFGIFILDACRDNPFVTDNSEIGRGLASMESEGGETLIGFATQAGDVAYDGTGLNSPYTGALVTERDKPGSDILDVFRNVRRSVRVWTDGQQRPFISASIEREFFFRPETGQVPVAVELGVLTLETVRPAVEQIWWAAIADSRSPDDFRDFLARFPESENGAVARGLTTELETSGQVVRGLELAQFTQPADSIVPQSLAAVVTACDISAGDPDDPRRITDGVRWGLVNMRLAVRHCSAALADDPTNPRLLHQMGRLLDIQSRYDEAEAFYRLAGTLDYSAALVNLGYLHRAARGREQDYVEAMLLYRKAADQGNLRARTNIGELFQRGWGVEADLDEAARWYNLAAQNGWPNALDTLANMYRNGPGEDGSGLPRDIDEAIRLYKVAAELGHTNAMNNLGQLYLRGDTGTPEVELGIDWLTRATELGNSFAPFNLGRIYRDGDLVPRDDTLAIELFQRAADSGNVPGRIALGRMYLDGRGVERSLEEAAFHFAVSALVGSERRPDEKEEGQRRLTELNLSPEALAAVQARASEWVAQNG